MWDPEKINELQRRRNAVQNGNPDRIAKQHESGKLTARERIDILFDKKTFCEINDFTEARTGKIIAGDGVVTGYGQIDGRPVFVASQDFTVFGGSLGEAQAKRICRVMDMAYEMKAPFISINDSGGARIEEGIDSLSGYGEIFYRNTRASGVIPQISVIMGPCAGGACYSPALTDFIFMVREKSFMFLTGPAVIKQVTHEEVTTEALGGAALHTEQSGVAHFAYDNDKDCLLAVRQLLSYLPQHSGAPLPVVSSKPVDLSKNLQDIVPDTQRKGYDIKAVIESIADKNTFLEIQPDFAKNTTIGLARIDSQVVGFVANQPAFLGGSMDMNGSDKISRFVRFCDCFRIPLVTLVDVPAFLPGVKQETSGIIRHGAKVLYAYSEATVPKITVILRKAYGGAYIAMCSKGLGADVVYAWPIAEIAVMGAEGAVNIVAKKVIAAAPDPEAERKKQIETYEKAFLNPYIAAAHGYVDEVILPEETRSRIARALEILKTKAVPPMHTHHGNIPL